MAGGRADSLDRRAAILGGLVLRNRVVGMLRLVVPGLGIAAFLLLGVQIFMGNLARQYGVAGVRIERGTVVVEAPQYAGTGGNGTRYLATAKEARTPLVGGNEIDMSEATLELLGADGVTYFAIARTAHMDTRDETITAPGPIDVTGSDGLVGTMHDVDVSVNADRLVSNGPARFIMADGTIIEGADMVRVGDVWTFSRATVTVPALPVAEDDGTAGDAAGDTGEGTGGDS